MSASASASSTTNSTTIAPLSGVTVLDLSRLLPGPYATQILVDLGATVIKIEDDEGDYSRYYPPVASDGSSAVFHALNRGKLSVKLNLKKEQDKQHFLQLCRTADVLVESFRPGVLARFGLGPQHLLSLFPHLIVCSITGYGQSGPHALRAGHDLNYLASSGVLGVMSTPQALPVQVADIAGGSYPAVIQILAALRGRERTGKGGWIDVSMCENAYSLLTMSLARRSLTGETTANGTDLLCGGTPCYRVYPTKDKGIHLAVGALEPKFFQQLTNALNVPHLFPFQFGTDAEKAQCEAELTRIFTSRSGSEWEAFFSDKDVMCEVILSPDEVESRNVHFNEKGCSVIVKTEGGDQVVVPRTPLRMSGMVLSDKAGPKLGEHTEQVLKQMKAKL